METLNFKPSKKGYILNHKGEIESIKYSDYLREFGSDETTTGKGIAPRLYVDGKDIYTWGLRGNNHNLYESYKSKREANKKLYEIWQSNLDENNEYIYFATSKKDLFIYLAECFDKNYKVIKRYFKIQEAQKLELLISKTKHENRPSFTKEMMHQFLNENKEMVKHLLKELDSLKTTKNKDIWQVKANSLVQKVCNNDFRLLKWKEVYNLIRQNINL